MNVFTGKFSHLAHVSLIQLTDSLRNKLYWHCTIKNDQIQDL
jgi:hypothetical protein